jgi:hypothetical protein
MLLTVILFFLLALYRPSLALTVLLIFSLFYFMPYLIVLIVVGLVFWALITNTK